MRLVPLLAVLLVATGCPLDVPPSSDAGRRPCAPANSAPADAGFRFAFNVCPLPDASVYVPFDFLTVLAPDGGAVLRQSDLVCGPNANSCNLCGADGGWCAFSSPSALVISTVDAPTALWSAPWNGHLPTASSCGSGGPACVDWAVAPPGTYRALFCFSLSVTRSDAGLPEALGPLDCVEEPFAVPLGPGAVTATLGQQP